MKFWPSLLLALCALTVIFYAVWEFNLSLGEYVRRPVMTLLYSVVVMGFLWFAVYTYLRSHGALQWDWKHLLLARFLVSFFFYAMWNFFISPIGDLMSVMMSIGIEIFFTAALFVPAFLPAPRKLARK